MQEDKLLFLIPFLPLLGAIISGLFALYYSHKENGANDKTIAYISCFMPILSSILAFFYFYKLHGLPEDNRFIISNLFTWISSGNLNINFELLLDPLSAVMIIIVTFVGSLIHIYSVGYMDKDRGFARYFSYLNLFTFSMLMLVLSKNLVVMFLGWEGVGLCSYLLIGFWFTDREKAIAGNKAFIVNRIGDLGFLLGIFLIFWTLQSSTTQALDFLVIKENANLIPLGTVTIITLLLFMGAIGKSAQIPLHVWLPDAMAGPTPVSALIHAATMVTAGIFMVARMNFLYSLAPLTLTLIAIVGVATAFFAATVAITQNDIKKILAYSTVSQLGYMFLGVGVGAYSAGMFHLFTHAFFKALLFLGAGSIIHAMSQEQNIWKMGGLWSKMKVTAITFLVATLAISGIPPFAGFFSKDEILWKVWESGNIIIYAIALITAGITAFYMARLFFVVFFGETKTEDKHTLEHIHESPKTMTIPLIILAIGSALVGFLGIPHISLFEKWLEPVFETHSTSWTSIVTPHQLVGTQEYILMILSVAVALVGILLAYSFYITKKETPETLLQNNFVKKLYNFSLNKWFFDEMYEKFIIKPLMFVSEWGLWKFFDNIIIDGLINGSSKLYYCFSDGLKEIQTGKVRYYAYAMMVGIFVMFVYIAFN